MWLDAKYLVKRARGSDMFLKPHLDELSWLKLRAASADGLLALFLRDCAITQNSQLS